MFLIIVKFTRKHLCRGLFLNKVAGWKPTNSSNRDSGAGVFRQVLRNSYEERFDKHLRTAVFEVEDVLLESLS